MKPRICLLFLLIGPIALLDVQAKPLIDESCTCDDLSHDHASNLAVKAANDLVTESTTETVTTNEQVNVESGDISQLVESTANSCGCDAKTREEVIKAAQLTKSKLTDLVNSAATAGVELKDVTTQAKDQFSGFSNFLKNTESELKSVTETTKGKLTSVHDYTSGIAENFKVSSDLKDAANKMKAELSEFNIDGLKCAAAKAKRTIKGIDTKVSNADEKFKVINEKLKQSLTDLNDHLTGAQTELNGASTIIKCKICGLTNQITNSADSLNSATTETTKQLSDLDTITTCAQCQIGQAAKSTLDKLKEINDYDSQVAKKFATQLKDSGDEAKRKFDALNCRLTKTTTELKDAEDSMKTNLFDYTGKFKSQLGEVKKGTEIQLMDLKDYATKGRNELKDVVEETKVVFSDLTTKVSEEMKVRTKDVEEKLSGLKQHGRELAMKIEKELQNAATKTVTELGGVNDFASILATEINEAMEETKSQIGSISETVKQTIAETRKSAATKISEASDKCSESVVVVNEESVTTEAKEAASTVISKVEDSVTASAQTIDASNIEEEISVDSSNAVKANLEVASSTDDRCGRELKRSVNDYEDGARIVGKRSASPHGYGYGSGYSSNICKPDTYRPRAKSFPKYNGPTDDCYQPRDYACEPRKTKTPPRPPKRKPRPLPKKCSYCDEEHDDDRCEYRTPSFRTNKPRVTPPKSRPCPQCEYHGDDHDDHHDDDHDNNDDDGGGDGNDQYW